MRFLCVCLSLSFCTCVCLFLRLSFHLKCCARVRLYYNRVPNSGETVENVLVKNDDNSRILCLSFAVVFASVAIVPFAFSFPRGCSSSRATSMEKTTSFFNSSSSRFSSSSGVNGVFWAHSFGYRKNVFSRSSLLVLVLLLLLLSFSSYSNGSYSNISFSVRIHTFYLSPSFS